MSSEQPVKPGQFPATSEVRAMFHVEFTFAGRTLRNQHETLCAAIANARHVLANWRTVPLVTVLGARRDGYPIITIVSHK